MGRDHPSVPQGLVEQLKVGLLEETLGGALGVRAIGDDHVEFVLELLQELEAVADVHLDVGVLEANAHAGEVLLGEADDGLYSTISLHHARLPKVRSGSLPHQCRRE